MTFNHEISIPTRRVTEGELFKLIIMDNRTLVEITISIISKYRPCLICRTRYSIDKIGNTIIMSVAYIQRERNVPLHFRACKINELK